MSKEQEEMRRASIKETGEELSQEEWARFDAAVADIRAERRSRAIGRTGTPDAAVNGRQPKPGSARVSGS